MAFGAIGAGVAGAQTVAPAATAPAVLSQPQVFPLDGMTMRKMANGGESRDVVRGALVTGEAVWRCMSRWCRLGVTPNGAACDSDTRSSLWCRTGSVMFEHGDKSEMVGAWVV